MNQLLNAISCATKEEVLGKLAEVDRNGPLEWIMETFSTVGCMAPEVIEAYIGAIFKMPCLNETMFGQACGFIYGSAFMHASGPGTKAQILPGYLKRFPNQSIAEIVRNTLPSGGDFGTILVQLSDDAEAWSALANSGLFTEPSGRKAVGTIIGGSGDIPKGLMDLLAVDMEQISQICVELLDTRGADVQRILQVWEQLDPQALLKLGKAWRKSAVEKSPVLLLGAALDAAVEQFATISDPVRLNELRDFAISVPALEDIGGIDTSARQVVNYLVRCRETAGVDVLDDKLAQVVAYSTEVGVSLWALSALRKLRPALKMGQEPPFHGLALFTSPVAAGYLLARCWHEQEQSNFWKNFRGDSRDKLATIIAALRQGLKYSTATGLVLVEICSDGMVSIDEIIWNFRKLETDGQIDGAHTQLLAYLIIQDPAKFGKLIWG